MFSRILSKEHFNKKIFLEIIVFLIVLFSLVLSYFFLQNKNTKQVSNKNLSIPKNTSYVPNQIIIKLKKEYSLEDLEKSIQERNKEKNGFLGVVKVIGENTIYFIKKEDVPEEKLKKLKEKLNLSGVISVEKIYKTENASLKDYYLLKLKPAVSVEKVYEEIAKFNEIETLQPNYIMQIFEVPNDPKFTDGSLWGLGSAKLDMEHAWNITKGSNNIKVAVIDTGIDYNHQDFVGRQIINGKDFSTGDCIGIGGAYDPPKPRDDDSLDDMGHGTHVAGTIGAVTNNALGIAGINWDVILIAVKTMSKLGCGQTLDIVEGIKYAADNGANVINMSLGGPPACSRTPLVQDVISYAINKKVIVVAAAGNDNQDTSDSQPASCDGVIAVGATNQSDQRAIFGGRYASNWGTRVDIAAPGTSILSTEMGGGFVPMQGTSMATPHVAGAAALLLSACPNLSPQQVRDYLVNNADSISTDMPIGPRLNVYKAINACTGGVPSPTSNPTNTPTPTGSTITPTNNPSLTPGLSPTSGISPTSAISPTSPQDDNQPSPSKKPTPTPVPYTCVPEPTCIYQSGQSNIQLCPLKCTPI